MVTAATYQKAHLFKDNQRLTIVQDAIFAGCERHDFELQAWAVLANHYHFIAIAPPDASLSALMRGIHGHSALQVNALDTMPGRKVWYRYWDTSLTFEKSYLARLHYVHHNAAHHQIVSSAEDYPFCSMSWFLRNADRPFIDTVLSFPIDRLNIFDDF